MSDKSVHDRITDYLASGGLFNPELANHDAMRDLLIDARSELAAKSEECEGLRKDAERYRWMRKQPTADIYACWYPPVFPAGDSPAQRDASIDAALREAK